MDKIKREDGYVYFGAFPQTVKREDVQLTDQKDARGYILGSDGAYYAEVKSAKPFEHEYVFSTGAALTSGSTYYFKVEPIKWRVLREEKGALLLVSERILAAHCYEGWEPKNPKHNNYKRSAVRKWLYDVFYAAAFDEEEQAMVQKVKVANGAASTGMVVNRCACRNTKDKVFLLSVQDVTNPLYGFSQEEKTGDSARLKAPTDYALAMGLRMSDLGGEYHYDVGGWWLRSPFYDKKRDFTYYYANYVDEDGYVEGIMTTDDYVGVVPAVYIALD